MNTLYENEIPKYLKQKESDVSKSKKKSKHKHQYEECLIQYYFKRSEHLHTLLSSYCTICGKIGNKLKDSIVIDRKTTINNKTFYSFILDDELYEKYHDKLPVFYVEDICKDGYVNLKEENK